MIPSEVVGWVCAGLALVMAVSFRNKVKDFKKKKEQGGKKNANRIGLCDRDRCSAVSLY